MPITLPSQEAFIRQIEDVPHSNTIYHSPTRYYLGRMAVVEPSQTRRGAAEGRGAHPYNYHLYNYHLYSYHPYD